jgi:hypothetical protein
MENIQHSWVLFPLAVYLHGGNQQLKPSTMLITLLERNPSENERNIFSVTYCTP